MEAKKVSIILPCRNESESITQCIQEIKMVMDGYSKNYEIVVSDSSVDGSDKLAEKAGAKIIKHDKEGYGLAIREGIKNSTGELIVFADADKTYDFKSIPRLLDKLATADLVMASRFKGKIEKGAMPLAHKILGTPLFNLLLMIFFGVLVSDSQSGFRAIRREKFYSLDLKTNGMEFATEMIIKASINNLKIEEIPSDYFKRLGTSKLKRYQDGFAHLKYIYLKIPTAFYIVVGSGLIAFGFFSLLMGNTNPSFNLAIIKILFPLIGLQILFAGLFAKTYLYLKFEEEKEILDSFYKVFKLKTAIFAGTLLVAIPVIFKLFLPSMLSFDVLLVLVILGLQIFFNSLILSTLSIK